jgi:hypothetical protein
VETPVYRREEGLWPHQNLTALVARLALADQVDLGKTVQVAMAAMLMALDDPETRCPYSKRRLTAGGAPDKSRSSARRKDNRFPPPVLESRQTPRSVPGQGAQ